MGRLEYPSLWLYGLSQNLPNRDAFDDLKNDMYHCVRRNFSSVELLPASICDVWNDWIGTWEVAPVELSDDNFRREVFGNLLSKLFFEEFKSEHQRVAEEILEELNVSQMNQKTWEMAEEMALLFYSREVLEELKKLIHKCNKCSTALDEEECYTCETCSNFFCSFCLNLHGCKQQSLDMCQVLLCKIGKCSHCSEKTKTLTCCNICFSVVCSECLLWRRCRKCFNK